MAPPNSLLEWMEQHWHRRNGQHSCKWW